MQKWTGEGTAWFCPHCQNTWGTNEGVRLARRRGLHICGKCHEWGIGRQTA